MCAKHRRSKKRKPSRAGPGKGTDPQQKAKTARRQKAAGKSAKKELPPQIAGWRLWLFRLLCVTAVPALFFVAVELVLRTAGYGFPASALIKHEVNGRPCYCDNVKFNWRFFPRNIAREFTSFVFPVHKPNNTYRIFVLGASAARGEPDEAFAFGRFLQVMLADRYPGIEFEVITAATAAINSHVVLPIAKGCARCRPDLFIVYLGNNEVTGPYGAGTVFAPFSGSLHLIRAGIALKATRLGQLLSNVLAAVGAADNAPAVWRGLEMFLKEQVRADDPSLETVYRNFERNLKDISKVAAESGAKVILCTVGSNLKDCPPFASLHRPNLTELQENKWTQIYEQGVIHEKNEQFTEAVECYLEAAKIDDRYADLQFRLGRCYWQLGWYEKARQQYLAARELDTLRFRADSRINRIIRDTVAGARSESIYLVDAVGAFESSSPHRTPGHELFYEHVHLNLQGSYLLAKTVLVQVEKILPAHVQCQRAEALALPTLQDCAQRLAYTEWDQHRIADEVLTGFIAKPPFTNQLYHDELASKMQREVDALKATLNRETLREAAAQYRRAVESAPGDWCLHYKYGTLLAEDLKDYHAAAEQFRLVQKYFPHCYTGYNALGSVLRVLGDLDGAIEQYRKALQINPTRADAHYYLGWVYQQQDRMDKAMHHYREALGLQPTNVRAYNDLGEVLYKQGKVDEAMRVCRKGLTVAPNDPILQCNLGVLLYEKGQRDAAIKQVEKALQLDPNSARVRKVLRVIRGP
jgi:tetratricopeptide (TPR) repeat protein